MKDFFVTLICRYGGGDTVHYKYFPARTAQSARNKARRYIKQCCKPGRYSLLAVDIINIDILPKNIAEDLKQQIAQAERELKIAKDSVQIADRKLNDLKSRLWAIKDLTNNPY